MKKLLFTFSLLLTMSSASAQKVLSLKDCLKIGIENNLSLKSSRNEVTKGKHNISENRARLLPQINFAHEEAAKRGITNSVASCTLMAELGDREMHIVPGSEKNIKVTTIEDLEILKALMHVEKEAWIK